MGDDGFFSLVRDAKNYLTGKKKGGFSKYDKVVDRILEDIPDRPQKMPKTTYGQKRRRDAAMRSAVSKRARTSTKKRKYKRTASKAYTKKRKPKTQSMSTKRHYDDSGNISRDNVAWFGAQVHGSRDRVFDIVGEAVTRAILARGKIYPRKYDEPMNNYIHGTAQLDLTFRSQSESDGVDTYQSVSITNVHTLTFKQLADKVTIEIQSRTGTASDPSFLSGFKLHAGSTQLCEDSSCEDMRISIYCKQTMKLQNTTQTNDNTNNLDVIGVNPLSGKRYVFNDNKARVHTGIISGSTGSLPYHAFEKSIDADGIVAMDQLASGDNPLAHPVAAKDVWSNCVTVQNCFMKAGGFAVSSESWRWTGTMRSLVEDLVFTGVSRTRFGRVVWWCFERANRNGGANTQNVSIGLNRELSMSCFAKLHKRPTLLKHYDNNPFGNL